MKLSSDDNKLMDSESKTENKIFLQKEKSESVDINKLLESVEMNKLLDSEYHMYSYMTAENEQGSIIVDSIMSKLFEDQALFEMDKSDVKKFTLRDLLQKGFISSGTIDIMEPIEIVYPNRTLFPGTKPKIIGKYMHGSRRSLIGEKLNVDFDYDPESDHEYVDYNDDDIDEKYAECNNEKLIDSGNNSDKTKKKYSNKCDWLLEEINSK
jgi:hypothetical protein